MAHIRSHAGTVNAYGRDNTWSRQLHIQSGRYNINIEFIADNKSSRLTLSEQYTSYKTTANKRFSIDLVSFFSTIIKRVVGSET